MAHTLVPLHRQPDLIKSCIALLYEEAPCGKHNRLEVLETSCPNPPCSLVLLLNENGNKDIVIGHCRIVPVKNYDDTLYIEAVVIKHSRRRSGYGSKLMKMIDEYCAGQGFKRLYLRTFPRLLQLYFRLGYMFTDFRPYMIGSGMLEHTIDIPLNLPFPGWECFYIESNHPLPHTTAAVEQGGLATDNQATDNPKVPPWAMDVYGYCHLIKNISVNVDTEIN